MIVRKLLCEHPETGLQVVVIHECEEFVSKDAAGREYISHGMHSLITEVGQQCTWEADETVVVVHTVVGQIKLIKQMEL